MKKLLIVVCAFIGLSSFAQEFPYELTVLDEAYVPLTKEISLTDGEIWDDPDLKIPLGFDFLYFGQTTDTIYIDGNISYGTMLSMSISLDYIAKIIIPIELDVIDAGELSGTSESVISYSIDGAEPNRICKIQWYDCAFYNEVSEFETAIDRANFQVWIYEGSNDIDFRYGEMSISNPEVNLDTETAAVGMCGEVNFANDETTDLFLLNGDPLTPTVESYNDLTEMFDLILLDDIPSEGTVYKFTSTFVGVEEMLESAQFQVYPTIVDRNVSIKSNTRANYEILSMSGKIINSGQLDSETTELNLIDYASGAYILKINSGIKSETFRIIKL